DVQPLDRGERETGVERQVLRERFRRGAARDEVPAAKGADRGVLVHAEVAPREAERDVVTELIREGDPEIRPGPVDAIRVEHPEVCADSPAKPAVCGVDDRAAEVVAAGLRRERALELE